MVSVLPDVFTTGVAVCVGVETGTSVGVGRACSVCVMAAETVSATIVSNRPGSMICGGAGAEAVGSPGTAQAMMAAKKVSAMKNVRLLFMVFFLCYFMKC